MLNKFAGMVAAGIVALSATAAVAEEVVTDPSILEAMKTRPLTVQDETVSKECGDCHMVFPPSRLTGNAWKKIMATLENHFGDDASLDAATTKQIEDYLVAHALDAKGGIRTKMRLEAWKKKGIVDPIRITETPEWTRHHTRERHYKNMAKAVGYDGGSNCIRCHRGAEHGLYEEFNGLYGDNSGD